SLPVIATFNLRSQDLATRICGTNGPTPTSRRSQYRPRNCRRARRPGWLRLASGESLKHEHQNQHADTGDDPRYQCTQGSRRADSANAIIETSLRHSLARPVRPARQHLNAVESFARGYVQRLPARSGEGDVGGLATQLDRAEIATLGIEYL